MFRIYYANKGRKFKFMEEAETLEDVKTFVGHYGFQFNGKDRNGILYYGDYRWNYVAVKEVK